MMECPVEIGFADFHSDNEFGQIVRIEVDCLEDVVDIQRTENGFRSGWLGRVE